MIEIQKNYKLTLTEQQAKELYEFLRGAKERFSGVNYADLRVVDVWVKYSIHEQDLEYGVLIEECSPTAYDFQDYMVEYLKDNLPNNLGWNVYVELEW
jgi:phage FluMu gp28-like protein